MAIDFVKNNSNYLSYSNGIGALLNGASKIAVSALINADSYDATSPTNNENCILRVMQNGTTNGLTFRVDLVASVPRVFVTARSVSTDSAQNVTGTAIDLSTGSWHQVGCLIDIGGDIISPVGDGTVDNSTAVTFGNTTWTLGAPSEPDRIGAHSATPPNTTDQFDGRIAELAIWAFGSAHSLSAADWAALGRGVSPLLIATHGLVFYEPFLVASTAPRDMVAGLTGTVTGSLSYATHPRVYMPARRRLYTRRDAITTPLELSTSVSRRTTVQRQGNIALPILHGSDGGGSAFTDDFTGAEDDTLESRTGWTRVDGAAGGAKINASNQVKNTTTTETAYTAPAAGSPDHYAQITAGSNFHTGGFTAFAPMVRVTDRNNWIGARANGSTLDVYKRVGGTFTQLAGIPQSAAAGDTLKLEIVGTTVKFYKNGGQIGSDMTVTDFPSVETPGVLCRTSVVASWFDNWESGPTSGGGGGGVAAGGVSRTAAVTTTKTKIMGLAASVGRTATVQRQGRLSLATSVGRTASVVAEFISGIGTTVNLAASHAYRAAVSLVVSLNMNARVARSARVQRQTSLSRSATVARTATVASILVRIIHLVASIARSASVSRATALSLPATVARVAASSRAFALSFAVNVGRTAGVAIAESAKEVALAVSRGFEVAVQIVVERRRVFRGGVGLGLLARPAKRWKSRPRIKTKRGGGNRVWTARGKVKWKPDSE